MDSFSIFGSHSMDMLWLLGYQWVLFQTVISGF